MTSTMGLEVTLSKANFAKDPPYDEEVAKNTADGKVEELPSCLRLFRKINYFEYNPKGWGKPMNLTMYVMYVLIAALVSANAATADPLPNLRFIAWTCYGVWQLLNFLNGLYLFGSVRQTFAWVGPYRLFLDILFQGGTVAMVYLSFKNYKIGSMELEYGLLIVMAGAIFVDQRMIDASFKHLYYYYHGAITKVELKDGVPHIAGISNSALLKIATAAGKALFIPEEAIETIQQELGGLKIREGKEDALDDWTYTIYKLTLAVSFAPSYIMPKSKISASQCRQLTAQMILFIRVYLETGKIFEDHTNRSAPLALVESLAIVMKLCFQVPVFFIIGVLPRSVYGVLTSALMPIYVGEFMNGLFTGNQQMALDGLIAFCVLGVFGPMVNALSSYTEALFVKKLIASCRQKMLRSTLKGGTEFDTKFRPGTLVDSFSSQLTQFELYMVNFFIITFPTIFQMIAGVAVSAKEYPPAVYLFISLVPLIFSVGYFDDRAGRASANKARMDAILSGKISSTVECRDAIRAADASEWIAGDMKDTLEKTDNAHFSSFLRSGFGQNYLEVMAQIYAYLIILPLGLGVINGDIPVGTFSTVQMAMGSLIAPIITLSMLTKMTTQTGGSIQSIYTLMNGSLDEEPSSKTSGTTSTLGKLSTSLSIKGIKFKYSPKYPDVIKGVNIGLSPGTYAVLCGESGSGKSTVLSLLMRFREPYEGTVEWDGKDIYGASLHSFRENVAVMFQRTMIYQGTIRDNILFGQPDVPGAVEKAARDAEIAEVIERLPDKYETVIGGDALAGMSGGQLQRVCMARALYKKPSVLLLDEATSALDAETEHSIIETLVRLRDNEGLTLVSVSHHPSTAVKADKIVVLERGVIAEEGTYDELVSRQGGIFKRIVEAGEEVQELE
uniref:ATP-dependent transporter ycf16 n=1 Tax=Skeletonema marinoi TaxID=267567 RepID=A0A7S2PV72_9STRA|mmetsp:Transcript_31770/g.53779  ORF Transcript_31770/g.53779 Transcript_31770/m.53779 type:complete len:898 (+) Transcript_31770:159-2852(+)